MHLNLVPARTGWQWVKLGIRTFMRQPLALTGLFFLSTVLMVLFSRVPLVGGALAALLFPSASLLLMVAAHEASQGHSLTPAVLFKALRTGQSQVRSLLVLGLLCGVSFALLAVISILIGSGTKMPELPANGVMTQELMLQSFLHPTTLSYLLLSVPLSLMFWHAPALVYWHGLPAIKSLFFSIIACSKNFLALTVYALAWVGVLLFLTVPVALIAMLSGSAGVLQTLSIMMAVVVCTMIYTSVYFTFRDSFQATPGDAHEPTPIAGS